MTSSDEQMAGPKEDASQPISLVIPGRAEYLALCRLVAGVMGVRESLDEETIADLKLVVTEACACYMWGPDGSPPVARDGVVSSTPASLRVDFHVRPNAWEIVISAPLHQHTMAAFGGCDPLSEGGLGLTIIKALVDTMEQTESESEGCVLRLVKRLSPSHIHTP